MPRECFTPVKDTAEPDVKTEVEVPDSVARQVEVSCRTPIARLDAELRARGVDYGTVLFGGYNIVAWKPYFPPPRRTWERDADDLAAVVQGVDGRFPMRPGVASFLRTHHDELEHFTVDELQVWIHEHGSIRERDGLTELPP